MRVRSIAAAWALPFAAVASVSLLGVAPGGAHPWLPDALSSAGALLGAAGVAFACTRRQPSRGWSLLAGLLPAVFAFASALRVAGAGKMALCDDQLMARELAERLAASIAGPLEIAARGSLRSGALLLVAAWLDVAGTIGGGRRKLPGLVTALAVAAAIAARVVLRSKIGPLDWVSAVVIVGALVGLAATLARNPRAWRVSALAAIGAVAMFDLGALAAAHVQVLGRIAQFAPLVLVEQAVAAEHARGVLLACDLALSAAFALALHARVARVDGGATELVGALALGVGAVLAASPLSWLPSAARLSAMDRVSHRLQGEPADAGAQEGWCLPAWLAGPAVVVDRHGTLHRESSLAGTTEARHGAMLYASARNTLGQLQAGLSPQRYTWVYAKEPRRRPELGVYAALVEVQNSNPSFLTLDTSLQVSEKQTKGRRVAAVLPEGERFRAVVLLCATQACGVAGAVTQEMTAHEFFRWMRDEHTAPETVIVILPSDVGIDRVAEVARGFEDLDVVVAPPRETIAPQITTAVAAWSRRLRAEAVALSRKAQAKSAASRAAFAEVAKTNPAFEPADLELVEGMLIRAKAEYFEDGFATAAQMGSSSR